MSSSIAIMGETASEVGVDLKRLQFRRQFLLGGERFAPNEYWSAIQLRRGLHLSVHKDLTVFSAGHEQITVTLLGHAIDPLHPDRTEADILQSLIAEAEDLKSIIDSAAPLVGRWIIIVQDDDGTYLFTDPCSFRSVYYYSDGKNVWCASQPELIRTKCELSLNTDDTLGSFLTDLRHLRMESAWIGSSTIYENCFHLMPNHFVNVESGQQTRFYPTGPIKEKKLADVIELSCAILQGTMTALVARYGVMVALTSGWDSRVQLAASRHVRDELEYFVYSQSNVQEDHPDIWLPRRIAKSLGLNFNVKQSPDELPGWFVCLLSQNVTCARILPKTGPIYDKLVNGETRINVNGNGSEICRNFFDKFCNRNVEVVSAKELAARMFGEEKASPLFVIKEFQKWKDGFNYPPAENLNIFDFLYWEQRLGNWGAQYPAEQDIAVEEISPFNCRLLFETLSAAPRRLRAAPDYQLYQDMMRQMWPEVLSFPINPKTKDDE